MECSTLQHVHQITVSELWTIAVSARWPHQHYFMLCTVTFVS